MPWAEGPGGRFGSHPPAPSIKVGARWRKAKNGASEGGQEPRLDRRRVSDRPHLLAARRSAASPSGRLLATPPPPR